MQEIFVIHLLTLAESICMYYRMDMARTKKVVSISPDPKLIERLEAWLSKQEFPPSKTAVFDKALEDFLDRRGG